MTTVTLSAPPATKCVCAEYRHPTETSKNSKTANAFRGVALPDIACHARTLTTPRAAGKMRLRAGSPQQHTAWFIGPMLTARDKPRHGRVRNLSSAD